VHTFLAHFLAYFVKEMQICLKNCTLRALFSVAIYWERLELLIRGQAGSSGLQLACQEACHPAWEISPQDSQNLECIHRQVGMPDAGQGQYGKLDLPLACQQACHPAWENGFQDRLDLECVHRQVGMPDAGQCL
jgi:hypothetical protein